METGNFAIVPEYAERGREAYPGFMRVVRWLCLLTLLAALTLVVLAQSPRQATTEQLLHDLRTGRVASVNLQSVEDSSSTETAVVHWRTGVFDWYQTTVSQARTDGTVEDLIEATAEQTGHTAAISEHQSHRILLFNVTDIGIWQPLALATGLIWLWTFIGMLAVREHPYANRWAWFWLFTIGVVGPLLFLWKEPEPLRLGRRRPREPHRWSRTPLTGGMGFVYAIGWTIVVAVAGSLLVGLAAR